MKLQMQYHQILIQLSIPSGEHLIASTFIFSAGQLSQTTICAILIGLEKENDNFIHLTLNV